MVVAARQSFQFFRQITWFLGNIRALPKFRYRILHKYKKINPQKPSLTLSCIMLSNGQTYFKNIAV